MTESATVPPRTRTQALVKDANPIATTGIGGLPIEALPPGVYIELMSRLPGALEATAGFDEANQALDAQAEIPPDASAVRGATRDAATAINDVRTEGVAVPDVLPAATDLVIDPARGEDVSLAAEARSLDLGTELGEDPSQSIMSNPRAIRGLLLGITMMTSKGNLAEAFAEALGAVGAAGEIQKKDQQAEFQQRLQQQEAQQAKDRLEFDRSATEATLEETKFAHRADENLRGAALRDNRDQWQANLRQENQSLRALTQRFNASMASDEAKTRAARLIDLAGREIAFRGQEIDFRLRSEAAGHNEARIRAGIADMRGKAGLNQFSTYQSALKNAHDMLMDEAALELKERLGLGQLAVAERQAATGERRQASVDDPGKFLLDFLLKSEKLRQDASFLDPGSTPTNTFDFVQQRFGPILSVMPGAGKFFDPSFTEAQAKEVIEAAPEDQRGMLQRTWDWVFGNRADSEAVAGEATTDRLRSFDIPAGSKQPNLNDTLTVSEGPNSGTYVAVNRGGRLIWQEVLMGTSEPSSVDEPTPPPAPDAGSSLPVDVSTIQAAGQGAQDVVQAVVDSGPVQRAGQALDNIASLVSGASTDLMSLFAGTPTLQAQGASTTQVKQEVIAEFQAGLDAITSINELAAYTKDMGQLPPQLGELLLAKQQALFAAASQ